MYLARKSFRIFIQKMVNVLCFNTKHFRLGEIALSTIGNEDFLYILLLSFTNLSLRDLSAINAYIAISYFTAIALNIDDA